MLIAEERSITSKSPVEIWKMWATPSVWSDWDPDVASVEFADEFVAGAEGSLKPTSGPRMKWHLESVTEHEAFVATSRLPGSTVRFIHEMRPDGNTFVVVHRIEMTGWTTPLFSRLVGHRLAPELATAVRNVAGTSEGSDGNQ